MKTSQTCWKSAFIMQGFCWHVVVKISLGFLCLFLVFSTASCIRKENKKEKQVAVLATAELPAKSLDLAAINLTELVNGMLSSALRGTKKLFSLLSVTSYSSFAFHKVSVTIYNISNIKNIDPGKFPMHYCYCLNNVTNDLTDFTALLVDIIGNTTSYLTEIFKSTSILSVRQSNDSDCIYICVMAGQTGKNLSDFLEILEKSPVINYTFSSNTSSDLDSILSSFVKLQEDPNKTLDSSAEYVWRFKSTRTPLTQKGEEIPTTELPPWPRTAAAKGFPSPHVDAARPQGTARPALSPGGNLAPSPALQPSPTDMSMFWMQTVSPQEASKLMQTEPDLPSTVLSVPPSYRPGVTLKLYSATRCPQAMLREPHVTSPPVTLVVQKIKPCVMELCRFFQLCLCVGQRRHSRKEAMRYCVEYYSWFVKNASYVCERVKRVAYSHTLKQKCLKNICTSV
ncbi:HERV-H LTR-associating protein 1 [Cyanistes caeruleus]|uniref:HHLA1 neighbor of OC90 n=1 Tax=Cyanistes caeruleus TaxID=156563 RepID=A0A8C0UNU0_CYACU|nr:HERV-H LTR-associating protein 1 [Cyanistes caeruleus]XP_023777296.1 HERV-H LTR-associating protein 1 [Cyanistes caeruleus]